MSGLEDMLIDLRRVGDINVGKNDSVLINKYHNGNHFKRLCLERTIILSTMNFCLYKP